MQTLENFDALDRKLDECRAAARMSDDAMRGVFQGFQMAFALDHPVDPFAPEYRDFQMRLYERVAGRPYHTNNEATEVDVETCIRRPFPFLTGSTATAGQHLGAVSFLLQSLRLRPGARILEFGPGWGNTTIALARLGFDVTAVDVEPRFCEIIRGQANRLGLHVDVVNADFFWAEKVTQPFDAVIFFECFHHCDDHMRLLRALHHAVVPDGLVYFGAEPILPNYPVPWGLRMDGEALWAVRQNGWLELGFRESYFRAALQRAGWIARKRKSADLPWISVWEAVPLSRGPHRFEASDPRLGTMTGHKADGSIRIKDSGSGYGVYGPHIPLAPGRYRAMFHFVPNEPVDGELILDACSDRGVTILGSTPLKNADARRTGAATLDFVLTSFADEVEVRLFCKEGAAASISALEIIFLPEVKADGCNAMHSFSFRDWFKWMSRLMPTLP